MALVTSMLKLFRRTKNEPSSWHQRFTSQGVEIHSSKQHDSIGLDSALLRAWLTQVEEEGFAQRNEGTYHLAWDAIYSLKEHSGHADALAMLRLPKEKAARVVLKSHGSLEDASFSISIGSWEIDGETAEDAQLTGPILSEGQRLVMLERATWSLVKEVLAFAQRMESDRNGQSHRLAWGRIRALAMAAGAKLDGFLHKTVVLTPEKLNIGIRKVNVGDDSVIEVQPTFDGAPDEWLAKFDFHSSVQPRYDFPTADGVVQVIVAPKVRTVLEEVKRLPSRRVAGVRAQAFVLNPYAALGEDAIDVIDEEQFEAARASAGLVYERFLPLFERDALDYPTRVGLLVESASSSGPTSSEEVWLNDKALAGLCASLRGAIERGYLLLAWNGYDFELQGDSAEHLAKLEAALEARQKPQLVITYVQVYDLSHYASRVQEIGFEKPYYSPFIAKKNEDEGWFPENIINVISWVPAGQTELVSMPIGQESLAELKQKAHAAKLSGKNEIQIPGMPVPMPVDEAERIIQTFEEAWSDAKDGTLDPEKPKQKSAASPPKRKSPVLLANIQGIDYAEQRRAALSCNGRKPELPKSLRVGVELLAHQLDGVAWLQTLYEAHQNYNCRGAVLADDMGLGKTLQLLTLMAWALARDARMDPVLVVAPVSLLENWKEEASKFFNEGTFSILTAYGEDLASLRVPREQIERRLREEDGLAKFLKPGWLGDARIVLTTYETLRDLEFSFAQQHWSIMVCDEAQKIKNPAAMVTRAAKKQNVAFKIACTGTPVENTLADLWCLFDYVQPGLLGALNDFGQRYRKPIEARTDDDRRRVEELRQLIAPQILRRTKAEVAKELPQKLVVDECRRLPLSTKQRQLYSGAIELFKRRNDPGAVAPFKNHLGLLHYLRLICTDPRRHGLDTFKPEPLSEYRTQAPKLDWLLGQLKVIQAREEKVIVFCEFRHIQRLLQHYIEQEFGIHADIINGDTSASDSHANSRQKRIRAFQAKPGFGVIILSPVAVGFGVNIQAANHVVHYTRTWNPAKEDQATDRAYRIGQTKDVFVYYPVVTAHDFLTFDVKLDTLLERKRVLAQDMLNGSGDLTPSDFGIEDVTPPDVRFREEVVTPKTALSMNWEYLEGLVTVLFAKRGFTAYRTPGSNDKGVDVVALPGEHSRGKLVQVKASEIEDAQLSWEAVKDVVTGQAYYAKQFPKADFELVCVTNQFFGAQAHASARLSGVLLIEQPQLFAMLDETPVTLFDVEKILFTEWTDA